MFARTKAFLRVHLKPSHFLLASKIYQRFRHLFTNPATFLFAVGRKIFFSSVYALSAVPGFVPHGSPLMAIHAKKSLNDYLKTKSKDLPAETKALTFLLFQHVTVLQKSEAE